MGSSKLLALHSAVVRFLDGTMYSWFDYSKVFDHSFKSSPGASQVATDTAQVVLLDSGISHLPQLFEMANGINRYMNNQIVTTLGVSILGVSGIFLYGWGIASIMVLNMISLLVTLGYALIDKPKLLPVAEALTHNAIQSISVKK